MSDKIEPVVTRIGKGFNVAYGDVLNVGVGAEQASTEAEALKIAQPQYEEFVKRESEKNS